MADIFSDKSKVVFFCDMDGTLLNSDKSLSEENADAIKRLIAAGGTFVVSTGRVLQAVRRYFFPLGIDCPFILCNGGMIYDSKDEKVLYADYLDAHRAAAAVDELTKEFPMVCAEICTPGRIYDINTNDTERKHWKEAGFDPLPKQCSSIDEIPKENWCKVLFAMKERFLPEFAEYCRRFDVGEFVSSSPVYHEMLPKGCSKGDAVKRFAEMHPEGIVSVAMGDFLNDLEMLQNADFAVCPSNGTDAVKAVCDMVCSADCDHAAVAEAINYILQ